jgi:hypothetical protein
MRIMRKKKNIEKGMNMAQVATITMDKDFPGLHILILSSTGGYPQIKLTDWSYVPPLIRERSFTSIFHALQPQI